MGFLKKIGGFFLGKASAKTTNDIFDKDRGLLTQVGGWIGNMQYTDEERAETDSANLQAVRTFVVDTLSENTDRSVARRQIAVEFMRFYMLMLFMCVMTFPVDKEWSMMIFNIATSLAVGGLVTSISVFFFGSHAMAKHTRDKQ